MSVLDKFKETKDTLDKISPSMCAAKWTQVTLHLGTGMTQSCHHPASHKIPLVELKRSPSALHNTDFKKEQRKKMLEGERPSECDYCWRVEDAQSDSVTYSDRITKSSEDWSFSQIDKISTLPWDIDYYPSYVEVDFDTTCNFKCLYCSPSFSTTWMQEIKSHGPIVLPGDYWHHNLDWMKDNDIMPIPAREENPYINAFWEWWPDAVKHMKVFRITGGEPLLSKNTFRVLDFLIANPQPQIEFNINSNLGVPDEVISIFVNKMAEIQRKGCVKSFKLYTSNEAAGKQAEYIRFGLNYDKWTENCHKILGEIPNSQLTIMAAFNFLSIPSFSKFASDVIVMKEKYAEIHTWPHRVALDTPYVRWPEFLAPWILDSETMTIFEEAINYMKEFRQAGPNYYDAATNQLLLTKVGFSDFEINRIERLFYVVREESQNISEEKLSFLRDQFVSYVDECDKRRNTNFVETFPELKGFYYYCKDR